MKRLFILISIDGKKFKDEQGEVMYFDNKMDAKRIRDGLNEAAGGFRWHVRRGADNKKSAKPHGRTVSGLPKYQRGNRGWI